MTREYNVEHNVAEVKVNLYWSVLSSVPVFYRFAFQSDLCSVIKTRPAKRPIFMVPKEKTVIAFKVKTAGEARILFSRTGLPYRKEFHYNVSIYVSSELTNHDFFAFVYPFNR